MSTMLSQLDRHFAGNERERNRWNKRSCENRHDSSRANSIFGNLDLLDPFERKQQLDQIGWWISRSSSDDGAQCVSDGCVESDALRDETGKIQPDALVGFKLHREIFPPVLSLSSNSARKAHPVRFPPGSSQH